jgi:hypothetical protein
MLVGYLEGISTLRACPDDEDEDAIADFLRFPGEICADVGFLSSRNQTAEIQIVRLFCSDESDAKRGKKVDNDSLG